jgi:hypothetical protein
MAGTRREPGLRLVKLRAGLVSHPLQPDELCCRSFGNNCEEDILAVKEVRDTIGDRNLAMD